MERCHSTLRMPLASATAPLRAYVAPRTKRRVPASATEPVGSVLSTTTVAAPEAADTLPAKSVTTLQIMVPSSTEVEAHGLAIGVEPTPHETVPSDS